MRFLSIIDIASSIADALMYFLIYEAFFERRSNRSNGYYCLGFLILAGAILVCNWAFMFSYLNIIGVLVLTFVMSFLYVSPLYKKGLIVIGGFLIGAMTEMISLYILMFLLNTTTEVMISVPDYRFLGIIISKILGLSVCNIIRIIKQKNTLGINRTYWKIFLLLSCNLIVVNFCMFELSCEIDSSKYNTISIIGALCMTCSTVFALYIYEKQGKQEYELQKQEQQKMYLKMQLNHSNSLLAKQAEVRRFRHDFFNQLITLRGYLLHEDIKGGLQYLDSLNQALENTRVVVDTGNTALDAILSTKKALAESKGIEFVMDVQISKQLPLSPVDVCIVFGNALDNAIEACEQCSDELKKITVVLVQKQGKLVCTITNTMEKLDAISFETSKPDSMNHGLGLLNLKESLEKYKSNPIFEICEGQFKLKFVIFE